MYSWACKPNGNSALHNRTDRLSVQDGDGYILIDVPDENFTEAYGVLLTSTSFSVPMCLQSTGHHHAYLRAIIIAACAVTECIRSYGVRCGTECYPSLLQKTSQYHVCLQWVL